ncbi:hypothetical protein AYI69_g1580 [Smittium culicis]|uniref:Uncharacterized protein n=1 Tax=Smittium culicis TaxID=133412 RepID=A0A1R1YQ23_9FUNG|nr:hypothetical protein AYI69_g1580 [Smittium culicis]
MLFIIPEIFSIDRNHLAYIGTRILGSASKKFGFLITSASQHIYIKESFFLEFKRIFRIQKSESDLEDSPVNSERDQKSVS